MPSTAIERQQRLARLYASERASIDSEWTAATALYVIGGIVALVGSLFAGLAFLTATTFACDCLPSLVGGLVAAGVGVVAIGFGIGLSSDAHSRGHSLARSRVYTLEASPLGVSFTLRF